MRTTSILGTSLFLFNALPAFALEPGESEPAQQMQISEAAMERPLQPYPLRTPAPEPVAAPAAAPTQNQPDPDNVMNLMRFNFGI